MSSIPTGISPEDIHVLLGLKPSKAKRALESVEKNSTLVDYFGRLGVSKAVITSYLINEEHEVVKYQLWAEVQEFLRESHSF